MGDKFKEEVEKMFRDVISSFPRINKKKEEEIIDWKKLGFEVWGDNQVLFSYYNKDNGKLIDEFEEWFSVVDSNYAPKIFVKNVISFSTVGQTFITSTDNLVFCKFLDKTRVEVVIKDMDQVKLVFRRLLWD